VLAELRREPRERAPRGEGVAARALDEEAELLLRRGSPLRGERRKDDARGQPQRADPQAQEIEDLRGVESRRGGAQALLPRRGGAGEAEGGRLLRQRVAARGRAREDGVEEAPGEEDELRRVVQGVLERDALLERLRGGDAVERRAPSARRGAVQERGVLAEAA